MLYQSKLHLTYIHPLILIRFSSLGAKCRVQSQDLASRKTMLSRTLEPDSLSLFLPTLNARKNGTSLIWKDLGLVGVIQNNDCCYYHSGVNCCVQEQMREGGADSVLFLWGGHRSSYKSTQRTLVINCRSDVQRQVKKATYHFSLRKRQFH